MNGAKSLDVRLYGERLGVVEQDAKGRVSFAYDTDAMRGDMRIPLSISMPMGTPTYSPSTIVPFLEGLLPDNQDVREQWAIKFGVSPRNAFALLAHIGRDCAGAVEFLHDGELDFGGGTVPLSDADIATRLRNLVKDPSGWLVSGERWSLAGAQSKFTLVRRKDGKWAEAVGSEPSTHIVKPGISDYRDQALIEHVSMRTAGSVGLRVAKTEYMDFDGATALVVTRFDRRRARDGSVVRVHQEDTCQALAVYPRRKYEASKGPTAADIARVLRDNSTDGEGDVWEFTQALVYNYLIGAPDAHAKNYSVMLAPGLTRITPLYDVASALAYEAKGDSEIDQAAMSIGGRRRFGTVHGRHWDRLARQLKVDQARLRDEIQRQAEMIPAVFAHEIDRDDATELRARLMPKLEHLCAATVTQLRD
jgi:serine/threonine-protein kinase HipA